MNEVKRRAIGLVAAICVLGITVLAATAQAELVTPHAASPQLITPQAVQPSSPAPSPAPTPVAEPSVEETTEEGEEESAEAPVSPMAAAAPQPLPQAQSQATPSADGANTTPVFGDNPLNPILEPLEELGRRLIKWWYCVNRSHYDRAFMKYLGLKNALGGAAPGRDSEYPGVSTDSIDDADPQTVTDLQNAEQAYWIIQLYQAGQVKGFERNCFNTRTP